jgi:hypothetical protein
MNGRSVIKALARKSGTSVNRQEVSYGGVSYDSYTRVRRGRRTITVRANEERVCSRPRRARRSCLRAEPLD